MTRFARIGERPRASKTDDLGSPHIPVSPDTWLLEAGVTSVPPPADLAPAPPTCGVTWRCGKKLSPLGRSPYGRFWPVHVWPDLRCPPGVEERLEQSPNLALQLVLAPTR
jgi:hypothetical protein